jgi:hypothetical protein
LRTAWPVLTRLASMLTIFRRLAVGEEMPAREKTRATAFPQPRRLYARLGWQQTIVPAARLRVLRQLTSGLCVGLLPGRAG